MDYLTAFMNDPDVLPPTIILLDVKLPYITGFEILQWMRDQKFFQKTLKIVFSASTILSRSGTPIFLEPTPS